VPPRCSHEHRTHPASLNLLPHQLHSHRLLISLTESVTRNKISVVNFGEFLFHAVDEYLSQRASSLNERKKRTANSTPSAPIQPSSFAYQLPSSASSPGEYARKVRTGYPLLC
jgi:hypothetical protein